MFYQEERDKLLWEGFKKLCIMAAIAISVAVTGFCLIIGV